MTILLLILFLEILLWLLIVALHSLRLAPSGVSEFELMRRVKAGDDDAKFQLRRDAVLPEALRGRPLEDYLVVDALERWAAGQAASILAWTFVVAAVVTAVAILPTLAMRNRPGSHARAARDEEPGNVVEEASRAGLAI